MHHFDLLSWGSQHSKEEEGDIELELELELRFFSECQEAQTRINSLLELLANPLIITTEELVSEFADWDNLRLKTIEDLRTTPTSRSKSKGTLKFCTLKIFWKRSLSL